MKEYAMYKGEEMIASGTAEEIARELGVKKETVLYYGTPTWLKRTSETAVRLVKL